MLKNILVIDDEELIIRSLKKLLEKNGFSVFVAKNGQDGIAMSDVENFNLIIADIRMPGMNGVETVQSIYDNLKQSNLKKIPVIFITGYADNDVELKARALGATSYIYKPFDINEFISVVKKNLG